MNIESTQKFKTFLLFFSFLLLAFIMPLSGQDCVPEGADTGDDLRIDYDSFDLDGETYYNFAVCGKPDLGAFFDEFIPESSQYGYFWDFGDGTYSIEESPNHNYLTPGPFYPKVYLVKRYVSSNKGRSVLRTSKPLIGGGDQIIINPPGAATASYSPSDSYTHPPLVGQVDFEPVFDLVPGYLQVFVLTFENKCSQQGKRDAYFTFPKGMFKLDSLAIFENPLNPAELVSSFIPGNSPPSSSDMLLPQTNISGDFNSNIVPGIEDTPDTVKFSIDFGSNAQNTLHLFLGMYASPFLPVGESIEFSLQVTNCSTQRASTDNNTTKEVQVRSSHDPNYKYVGGEEPAAKKSIFITGSQPTKIYYRISFQNEGDGTEHDISISDTLAQALDFNTFKLLNIEIAGNNTAKNICDYPPIWREYLWDRDPPSTSFYEITKDPVSRIINIKLRTNLWGKKMVNLGADFEWEGQKIAQGDTFPEDWSWGHIDFEIYTDCSINEAKDKQVQFVNHAGVVFGSQDPVLTDDVSVSKICYDNEIFVLKGNYLDLDVVSIANQFYPNENFDYRTAVITHSKAGIKYPFSLWKTQNPEYRYSPQRSRYSKLDTSVIVNRKNSQQVLIDNLRYTICGARSKKCYPISVFVMINPDSSKTISEYNCEGDCTPATPVKDPYPLWWYILGGLILFILIISSARRKGARRRRARRNS